VERGGKGKSTRSEKKSLREGEKTSTGNWGGKNAELFRRKVVGENLCRPRKKRGRIAKKNRGA